MHDKFAYFYLFYYRNYISINKHQLMTQSKPILNNKQLPNPKIILYITK